MAKLETFTENFANLTQWTLSGVGASSAFTVSNNQLNLANSSGQYETMKANTAYDATGSYEFINVVSLTSAFDFYFGLLDSTGANYARWEISGGSWLNQTNAGNWATGTYSYTGSMQWIRIRESGGSIFFEYSPDCVNWTLSGTATSEPFTMTSAFPFIEYGVNAAVTGIIASLNIAPVSSAFRSRVIIPNPHVGPMALRKKFHRTPRTKPTVRRTNQFFA